MLVSGDKGSSTERNLTGDKMIIEFHCPVCGNEEVLEIRKNVTMSALLCNSIRMLDNGEIEYAYAEYEETDGSTAHYKCSNCDYILTSDDGHAAIPITTPEELWGWLDSRGMLVLENE